MIDQIVDGLYELTAIEAIKLADRLNVSVDTVMTMVAAVHAEDMPQTSRFWRLIKQPTDDIPCRPIQAIKLVREYTGLPLKEAKSVVDGNSELRVEHFTSHERADLKSNLEANGIHIVASEGKLPSYP